jgi:hypothetical protein
MIAINITPKLIARMVNGVERAVIPTILRAVFQHMTFVKINGVMRSENVVLAVYAERVVGATKLKPIGVNVVDGAV